MGQQYIFRIFAYTFRQNSLGIFRSDDVSHYQTVGDTWEFYWFRFDQSDWEHGYNWVAELPLFSAELKHMEDCFSLLNHNTAGDVKLAESLFYFLLCKWMTLVRSGNPTPLAAEKLSSLLEEGLREKKSIHQLAHEAGMSDRGFRNAVHQVLGMSPKDYIQKLQMQTAMDLLQTTTYSISEISLLMQYEYPSYFSRAFKKFYGISPSQARDISVF